MKFVTARRGAAPLIALALLSAPSLFVPALVRADDTTAKTPAETMPAAADEAAKALAGDDDDDAAAQEATAKAEVQAKSDADAKVAAATAPLDKANALLARARLPEKMSSPDAKDWQQAADDLKEAERLVVGVEADGKTKVKGSADIYFQQGYTDVHLNDYKTALTAYNQAKAAGYLDDHATMEGKGSELLPNMAFVKSKLLDFDGALDDYTAALALNDTAKLHRRRAETLYDLGRFDDANNEWKAAQKLDATIKSPPFDEDEAKHNLAVVTNPTDTKPLMERARYRVELARKAYNEKSDTDIDAILGMMGEPVAQNYILDAVDDLDRALAIDPKLSRAWLDRGRLRNIYLQIGSTVAYNPFDEKDVLTDFEKSTKLDPGSAAAWYEVGNFRSEVLKRRIDAAAIGETVTEQEKATELGKVIEEYSRAIALQPGASGLAHLGRASAERQFSPFDTNGLLVDYNAAIEQKLSPIDAAWQAAWPAGAPKVNTSLADAYLTRARIYLWEGRSGEALADFDGAVAADSTNAAALFERGKLRVQRGDYDGALADITPIVTSNPKAAEPWLWSAAAHEGKGESDLAKSDIKEALSLDPRLKDTVKGTRYDPDQPVPNQGIAPAPNKTDAKMTVQGTVAEHIAAGNALKDKGDLRGALQEYFFALWADFDSAPALDARGQTYAARGETDLALADFDRALQLLAKHPDGALEKLVKTHRDAALAASKTPPVP